MISRVVGRPVRLLRSGKPQPKLLSPACKKSQDIVRQPPAFLL